MAKTILLGKKAYRVLKRRRTSISLQPLDSEYPHTLIMQDPTRRGRWGHVHRGSNDVTWYRKVNDDLFEKIS